MWNIYNVLLDHLDMIQDLFYRKDPEKTSWIAEFITAVDTGTEKLKEYYSKTGGPVEMQYALAAMFDPSQKLDIFSSPEWGCLRCKKYMKIFVEYWSDYYQNLSIIKEDQP
jgi:hypothetical protein